LSNDKAESVNIWIWTNDAGKERSMHVCVAQATAGRNPMQKSVS